MQFARLTDKESRNKKGLLVVRMTVGQMMMLRGEGGRKLRSAGNAGIGCSMFAWQHETSLQVLHNYPDGGRDPRALALRG